MLSALLLTIGIALLILGVSASESAGSSISNMFRGTPSDRATMYLLFGTAATVTGLVGVFLTFRSRPPD
jgi:hypothetical protein